MQKTTNFKKICSLCLCILLIATIALVTTACTKNEITEITSGNVTDGNIPSSGIIPIGKGDNAFLFTAVNKDGKETRYAVASEKTIVGEALQELGLIDGEEGPYGIYIKTVCGDTYDYDKDGYYWAFYIDEDLAEKGADMTEIQNGTVYRFVATKG